MTTGELIEDLSKYDPDTIVLLRIKEANYEATDVTFVETPDDEPFNDGGDSHPVMPELGAEQAVIIEGEEV